MKTALTVGAVAALVAAALAAPVGAFAAPTAAPTVAPTAGPAGVAAARARSLVAAQQQAATVARQLRLDGRESLRVKDLVRDPDGATHVRYDRTFAGLRVIGGDLVVHRTPSGAVRRVDKAGSGSVDVASTAPKLSRRAATTAGRLRTRFAPARSSAQLVVYAGGARPRLAYDVLTTGVKADQTPSRLHTIVDALTGARLTRWDDIETGTGNSIYSGVVSIGTTPARSGFSMTDPLRGGNTTSDLLGDTAGTGTVFTDADDVWGDGTPGDRASAGVDAQYGAGLTWDYYKNTFGRNGIFNDGQGVPSRVHFGDGYVNAFWDGSSMTYGDGSGNVHPLTEIDVAGHEMTHGVTQATANLMYEGDAGGLNEATSDIFGTAVEFSADNPADPGDYLIGEKIDIFGDGTPLRFMDRPSRDGVSPDCWSADTANLDPHLSSGVGNHFFYLASEGSGPKTINAVDYDSPTCDGSTIVGIGRQVVEQIWYRALTTYMTSTTTYSQARDATMRAAVDLYGAGSVQCATVERTWEALSVPAGTASCGAGAPPAADNLLRNPGFESGLTGWTATKGAISASFLRPPHTGTWKARLGGHGDVSHENVTQSVAIPATATAPTFSFWLRTDTAESGLTPFDTLKVQVLVSALPTTTLATFSNVGADLLWSRKSVSLAAFTGKTVRVRLLSTEDASLQTTFDIDDTAVTTG